MGWNPENWQPSNVQPPNWQPPVSVPLAVDTIYTRSAFLDRFGRYAKTEETIAFVRLWPEVATADQYLEYTLAQFNRLTPARQQEIKDMGSAAGLVDTEGKSNA